MLYLKDMIHRIAYLTPVLLLFSLVLLLSACKPKQGTTGKTETTDFSQYSSSKFDFGQVSFSLADFPELTKVHRDSVAWTSYVAQTREYGPIVYYFTEEVGGLSSPHIQVHYIAKSMEGMETIDNVHAWLKETFVNPQAHGELIMEDEFVQTQDGREVELIGIRRNEFAQNDSITMGLKLMAWGYIDHGDRFVALNFTATDTSDYNQGFPQFTDLIRSYRQE